MTAVGRVGVFAAQTAGCGVFVHHRVHASGGDAEKQAGTTEFLEVTEVAVPVGLGNDAYAKTHAFKQTTNYSHSE